jgi:threonine dehydratase
MITIEDVYNAEKRLAPYLATTPLIYSFHVQRELKKKCWLKLETQQPTGSFKPRPAFNSILTHLDAARAQGVIASSSGNFAQGVAFAARELSVNAMIIMTKNTSPYKIERTKQLGAEVVLCENSHEARVETTLRLQQETGRLLLHPYDTFETIAGDGTLGLELSRQLGDQLNGSMSVLVPISGGGLIAGISFTLKHLHSSCKIIGIQPKNNGSIAASLAAGKCVNIGPVKTIADALVASSPGEKAFSLIRDYVDDIILVEEDEIQSATRFLIEQHKLVVEPAGAIGMAALFSGKVHTENTVCVLSGGNIKLL